MPQLLLPLLPRRLPVLRNADPKRERQAYAPYVLLSIFAGALSDRWNKKATMLICDTLAAATTVAMLILLQTGRLQIWHLYLINGINGVMNTVLPCSRAASLSSGMRIPSASVRKAMPKVDKSKATTASIPQRPRYWG